MDEWGNRKEEGEKVSCHFLFFLLIPSIKIFLSLKKFIPAQTKASVPHTLCQVYCFSLACRMWHIAGWRPQPNVLVRHSSTPEARASQSSSGCATHDVPGRKVHGFGPADACGAGALACASPRLCELTTPHSWLIHSASPFRCAAPGMNPCVSVGPDALLKFPPGPNPLMD